MQAQRTSGGHPPRPLPCYNCGRLDHFAIACPELPRNVPAGLSVARQTNDAFRPPESTAYDGGPGQHPNKRQRTGPVVTKFPGNGPIITRYAVPPSVANKFPSQNIIGSQPNGSYSQPGEYPTQHQQYSGTHPAQPGPAFVPSGQPSPYSQPGPGAHQYAHPIQQGQPPYSQPQPYFGQQPYNPNVPYMGQYQYPPTSAAPNPQQRSYSPSQGYATGPPSTQQFQYPGQYQGNNAIHNSTNPNTFHTAPLPNAGQQWSQSLQPNLNHQPHQPHPPSGFQNHAQSRGHHHGQSPMMPQHNHTYTGTHMNGSFSPEPTRVSAGSFQDRRASTGPSRPLSQLSSPAIGTSQQSSDIKSSGQVVQAEHPFHNEASIEDDLEWEMNQIFKEEQHRPPYPVAYPLPAVFDDVPVARLDKSRPLVSKYIRPDNMQEFTRPIRESQHWTHFRNDPVFADMSIGHASGSASHVPESFDSQEINVAQTHTREAAGPRKRSWEQFEDGQSLKQRCSPAGDLGTNSNTVRNGQDSSRGSVSSSSYGRAGTPCIASIRTPNMDNAGTPPAILDPDEDDVWAPRPGEGALETSPTQISKDPVEDILASLGVTGAPKPVTQQFYGNSSRSDYSKESRAGGPARHPTRYDSGYGSSRGSYSNGSSQPLHQSPSNNARYMYNEHQPAPPPPPPGPPPHGAFKSHHGSAENRGAMQNQKSTSSSSHRRNSRGVAESPLSPTSAELLNFKPGSVESPLTPTSAELLNLPFPSSGDKRSDKRRRDDDVTPRLKRPQPIVDSAYSRRW